MRKILLVVMLALLVIVPAFAQDEEKLPTLAEIVASREDLSSFATVAASVGLDAALADATTYATLFVPNNDAFQAALDRDGIADLNAMTEAMTPLGTALTLASHIVPGHLSSTSLGVLDDAHDDPYWLGTLTPGVGISVQDGMLNETIKLVEVDLFASNGVIHIIDTVIFPTTDQTTAAAKLLTSQEATDMRTAKESAGTIPEVAAAAGTFTTLLGAVDATGMTDMLAAGSYTVFAPSDDAFAAGLESMGTTAEDLMADTDSLSRILAYHVVPATLPASALATMNGFYIGTMLPESVIQIGVDDAGALNINGGALSQTDILAKNGLIHVIDGVLIPPAAAEEAEE